MPLLDAVHARGFRPEVAIMDMGYDHEAIYADCEQRDCHPIIPLRQTPAVKAGKHLPPVCEHGEPPPPGVPACPETTGKPY